MFPTSFKTLAATCALACLPSLSSAQMAPPVLPEMDVDAVSQAWNAAPAACRISVQKALAGYDFYDGAIDGQLGASTIAGIKAYVAAGEELEWNTVTVDGAKGLLWHIGMPEPSCNFPELSTF